MKKAQWTDLFREIKRSKGRYLSLLFIVALGTAFYAGVRSSEPDMTASVDKYYDDTDFMDVRIMGTLGLTDEDIQAIADTDGISQAEGGYSTELFAVCQDDQPVMSVVSACENMNRMTITEGRMPETADECFMDAGFMNNQGYEIGDQVTLIDENGNSPEDMVTDTYTIVGSGTWSWYLSWSRGSASIGDGLVDAFMVVSPEAFDMDCYTVVYALVDGVTSLNSFSDAYDDAVELVTDRLEAIAGDRCQIRYAQVYEDARNELTDARTEVEDAEKELADARQELTDGEQEYEDGKKKYEEGLAEYEDGKKQYEEGLAEYEDGKKQYEEGLAEYEDGKKQYEEGLAEYEDGKKQYEDGLAEYEDGKQQLAKARKELDDGWAEYNSGVLALSDADQQLSSAQDQIEDGEKQLSAARSELASNQTAVDSQKQSLDENAAQVSQGLAACEEGETKLSAAEKELAAKKQELESGRSQLNQQQSQLDALFAQAEQVKAAYGEDSEQYQTLIKQAETAKQTLEQMEAELSEGETQLAQGQQQLETQKAELEAQKAELLEAQKQIESGYAAISSAQDELDAGSQTITEKENELTSGRQELEEGQSEAQNSREQLAQAKQKLEEGEASYQSGLAQLNTSQTQLEEAKKQLEEAKQELAASKKQLDDAQKELEDAKQELDSAWKELQEAAQELEDGQKELEEAAAELSDARKELDDGWKEYEDARAEAEPELEDARAEIADGEQALEDLEEPEWYVLDRNTVQTSVEYGMDAERIGAIGKVFPAIFFLVAALVSLTTMTRMIEEERTLIGTMKALGYGKLSIASKYILYALSATLAGGIFGVLLGSKLLPYVIMTAYGMLYSNTHYMLMPLHAGVCLFSIGLAVLCTVGAAFAACYKELLSTPASLMRPPSPKQGKRVFLERVPVIWKRLNFSMKSTIRNLVRYKKRLFMTVFGIGGCMALLLVSFGLHDSIAEIVNNQYKKIWTYSASCDMDESKTQEEQKELLETITREQPEIESGMLARRVSMDVSTEKAEKTAYFYVVEDREIMKSYLDLHDRITDEPYELTDDGVIITEKLAHTLDVEAGDTITLKLDDTTRKEVTVTAVAENYLYHYVYVTPAFYQELYGEEPEYNELFLKFAEGTDSETEGKLAEYLLGQDMVTSVSLVTERQAAVDDMMNALNLVVWVLIISAGLLVFVVLFNLNNINISERRRELASLKVLGFYDMEVAMYVYRENVFLTCFGIIAGLFMGTWLHRYTILTLEVDMIMFGRNISIPSYLYSILFTLVFAVLVNMSMYYKLKQIDMVESLKSVE